MEAATANVTISRSQRSDATRYGGNSQNHGSALFASHTLKHVLSNLVACDVAGQDARDVAQAHAGTVL
jgi:hypothetical protein